MNKRLTIAYSIFSLVVFSFLIVWFVFRAINTRSENFAEASAELETVKKTITSSYLAEGSFSSEYFASRMKELVSSSDQLKAVVIYGKSTSVEYAVSSDASYISMGPAGGGEPGAEPEFSANKIQDMIISSPVIIPTTDGVRVETMFRILSRSDIFPIIRELLIGLLSFLLITAIMILVSPHLKKIDSPLTEDDPTGRMPEDPKTISPEIDHQRYAASASETQGSFDTPASPSASPSASPPASPSAQNGGADADIEDDTTLEPTPEDVDRGEVNGLYSPKTNLGWENYLVERLSAELRRAASFDQDLVLFLCAARGITKEGKLFADIAQGAIEFFSFRDLCFEYGNSGFGVVIPNIDLDQGIDRVEAFMAKANIITKGTKRAIKITSGLSARNGRLISGDRIMREAEGALRKARDEENGIVAFRVDPQKYREYLSSKPAAGS